MKQYGLRSVTSSVQFVGIPTNYIPVEVNVRQALGMHDIAELVYQQKQPWMDGIWNNTPAQINWGNANGAARFVGYASHSAPISTMSTNQPVKMYCIGASFPMKERGTDVWLDMTGPAIAQQIARKFRLQAVTDDSSFIIPQVLQAGRTYWEVLNDVAEQCGFVVQCVGVTVVFRKRDSLINSGMSLGMQFSLGGDNRTALNLPERNLWHFRPRLGKYIDGPHARADQSVTGVDPVTLEVHTSVTGPAGDTLRAIDPGTRFTEYAIDRTVHSQFIAGRLSEALSESVRMSVSATAVASGDARVRPGLPVYIRDTGSATDGYWMVSEVIHKFKASGEYEMDMVLHTDSIGADNVGAFRPGSPPSTTVRDLTALPDNVVPFLTPSLLPAKIGSKDQYWTCGGAV